MHHPCAPSCQKGHAAASMHVPPCKYHAAAPNYHVWRLRCSLTDRRKGHLVDVAAAASCAMQRVPPRTAYCLPAAATAEVASCAAQQRTPGTLSSEPQRCMHAFGGGGLRAAAQPSITVPAVALLLGSDTHLLYLVLYGMVAGLCSPPPPNPHFSPSPPCLPIRWQPQPRQVLDRIVDVLSPPSPPPPGLPIRRQPQPRQVLDRIVELARGSEWGKASTKEQDAQVLGVWGGIVQLAQGSAWGQASNMEQDALVRGVLRGGTRLFRV